MWPIKYFAQDRQLNNKKSRVIVFVHSTWSWWDQSSQAVVELWTYIHKLTMKWRTDGPTDGRTDKHDVSRTITFNRSCNVLKVNPSGRKKHTIPNVCQNRRPYRTQTYFNSRHPRHLCSAQRKMHIWAFHEEIHAFEAWIIIRSSSLVHASEWTTNRKKVCSLIDRFMTSDLFCPLPLKRGNL